MRTYKFKKGNTWIDSDYPPFDLAWRPRKRFQPLVWLRYVKLPWWVEWVLFLASYALASWAIVQALKTIWPGL
jgi:hypothetical protein